MGVDSGAAASVHVVEFDLLLRNLSNALAKSLILGSSLAEFVECPC